MMNHDNSKPDYEPTSEHETQVVPEGNQRNALKECQFELENAKNRYQRLSADFENFKKRIEKDQATWRRIVEAAIFADILAIVDNFERAFKEQKKEHDLSGFQLIYKEFQKFLEKYGVTEIKESKSFDPELHEAIMNVSSPEHTSGDIVAILQKGYMFRDQVLRPAKVSLAQ